MHPRSARAKVVQNVQMAHHGSTMGRTLLCPHASRRTPSKAPVQPTSTHCADPTQLGPKACAFPASIMRETASRKPRPTVHHKATRASRMASMRDPGCTNARTAPNRTVQTINGSSRAAHRRDGQQVLRGLSIARQQLLAGSRPSIDCFESILSVVRRRDRRARRSWWCRRLRLVDITLLSS